MISVESLSKTFVVGNKIIPAVDDVTFKVERGQIQAIVGHNGAGKTTVLKIISTLIVPDSGTVSVNGFDVVKNPKEVRKILGVMTVSERAFYYRLSGLENLVFFGTIRGLSVFQAKLAAKELMELVGLWEWRDVAYMKYSTGMARKLALARALLTDPQVILMDEPTLGMDPISSREFRRLVQTLSKEKTILLTSHNMVEVEDLAKGVVILNRGKVVAKGSSDELKRAVGLIKVIKAKSPAPDLRKYVVASLGDYFLLRVPHQMEVEGEEIGREQATLEDAFVYLTDEWDSYRDRRRGGRKWAF
ncbi:ABC transporter ATP-binding protein [Metallosphaera tengchongensis]|uniref:ABC transporter ATP-binding protein n=1 Tax=Metallosphaera tengchongensis TaxID=1532350 RepID=A0A6N0NU67_9CREN|nr:ABC transporter ATP-binding protein [Metallosphaera tengchongensis]QKQ99017.1 ABC transporter ATP-binding protein [Metallosphaera tengchongensis]